MDEGKTWFNGLNMHVFMACHAFLLSLTLNSCVNRQKVNRYTVYRHRKIVVYSGKFCIDTESTHIVSDIPKLLGDTVSTQKNRVC